MRDITDAAYAVDRLQESYDEARDRGESHGDAIASAAGTHGIETFKVAALVRSPEMKQRAAEARARTEA